MLPSTLFEITRFKVHLCRSSNTSQTMRYLHNFLGGEISKKNVNIKSFLPL